jgi:hypothetical protein
VVTDVGSELSDELIEKLRQLPETVSLRVITNQH